MKIAYYGDGEWAHRSLELLIQKGFDIAVIIVRFDKRDETLIQIGGTHKIPVLWTKNVNTTDWIEKMKSFETDLAISMSFNQIIRPELREIYPKGFINVHAGKLPNYRGRNILNWALINDEKEIGVTCHYIDDGIDTGDIIHQECFQLTDEDDYGTVLQKAFTTCPKVLFHSVSLIANGDVQRTKQPLLGSYFIARKVGDEWIDWNQSSRQLFNFIRALNYPGPFAQSRVVRKKSQSIIYIKQSRVLKNFPQYMSINGGIVGFTAENNPIVKTQNGALELLDWATEEKGFKLRIGDRFQK